jgi:glycine/D-amino acid oxidase-like deaminating enzyme
LLGVSRSCVHYQPALLPGRDAELLRAIDEIHLPLNRNPQSKVLVLGAGIQGLAVALALHRAGWRVEILDRAPAPMLNTSLRGEGKLHLGYVYGNEPSRETAHLMVAGALSFAKLLDRWLPQPIDWQAIRSEPFAYAVLSDSMVSPTALAEHYAAVDDAIAAHDERDTTYAGLRRLERARAIDPVRDGGFAGDVIAAFRTGEVAIDPAALRQRLIAALDAFALPFHANARVLRVTRTSHGFAIASVEPGGPTTHHADAVVNCLWEGRLAIDATLGIAPPRPCLYRLRYAVHGRLPAARAERLTTTFALGPFGDVVARADGRVYLSWYPVGLAGLSQGLEPPAEWQTAGDDPEPVGSRGEVATATLAALAGRLPALREVTIEAVTAGIVVAWGERDIDHPESELHRRHAIGVYDHDGYLSVDTGKLTTAPLFAERVAQVLGPGRR